MASSAALHGLRQRLHPTIQIKTRCRHPPFGIPTREPADPPVQNCWPRVCSLAVRGRRVDLLPETPEIAVSAVLSLVTIISIYREGGILKRLRATPLRPQTILTAHVVVKLILTAATLALLVLAGKRYYPVGVHAPLFSFTIALLISTWSILSIGFLIASIVPTARFAQPIGAFILYPMIGVSGLFVPVASLPPVLRAVAKVVPLTYAVSLLEGIWKGDGWSAHVGDVAALVLVFVICTALSAKVFRWE